MSTSKDLVKRIRNRRTNAKSAREVGVKYEKNVLAGYRQTTGRAQNYDLALWIIYIV